MRTSVIRVTVGWLLTATAAAAVSGILLAENNLLDVKLGAWELTTTANSSAGQSLPPEVDQHCITRDNLQNLTFLTGDLPPGYTCKPALTTNTKTVSDFTLTCTGPDPITFTTHVEAASTTSIKGTAKVVTTENGVA